MADRPHRGYVIVVHGIGEQKHNETATAVVHRFAEVLAEVHQHPPPKPGQSLVPSYLSAQSVRRGGLGHGWSEFDGIPLPGEDTGRFTGIPATANTGRNYRFVDFRWSHILQYHQERYASPPERWTKALLERLRTGMLPNTWLEPWVEPMLESVVATAIPIYRLLSVRNKELAKRVFFDFLGDYRGGPQVLDSLAASLRWSPSRVVMPPFRGFGHRGAAPSW